MDNTNKILSIAQDKLRAINTLTNCMAKIDNVIYLQQIAYLMHKIIELDGYIDSNIARQVLGWQLKASGDIFVQTNN